VEDAGHCDDLGRAFRDPLVEIFAEVVGAHGAA
jgi:hypothetical protein